MIYLVGVGMGHSGLSEEARACIQDADVLIGAKRMLELPSRAKKIQAIKTQDILEILKREKGNRVVLFSGDTGFYSGATKLLEEIQEEVKVIPGISSPVYFASKLGIPWEDFHLVSAHGRKINLLGEVLSHDKVFLLTAGEIDLLLEELLEAGLDPHCVVGENLSYPEERILQGKASELIKEKFQPLSVLLISHKKRGSVYLKDEDFLRGKVPMTKENLRSVILHKLAPTPGDVLFDLGSGTGSVGISFALLEPYAKVHATEYKEEALELSRQNKLALGAYNLFLHEGRSEELIQRLPQPNKVFVGGSSGGLRDCLEQLLGKGPFYFLMSAISLESLEEGKHLLEELDFTKIAITQIAVTGTVKRGSYTMLQAENPIFLLEGYYG